MRPSTNAHPTPTLPLSHSPTHSPTPLLPGKGPMDTAILYGMDTNVAGLLTTNLSSLTSRPDGVRTPIKEHPAPIRED